MQPPIMQLTKYIHNVKIEIKIYKMYSFTHVICSYLEIPYYYISSNINPNHRQSLTKSKLFSRLTTVSIIRKKTTDYGSIMTIFNSPRTRRI